MARNQVQTKSRTKRGQPGQAHRGQQGLDIPLASVLTTLSKIGSEETPRWLFPHGIDSIQFAIDAGTGHLDLKVSGPPQGSGSTKSDALAGLTLDSIASAVAFARAMERIPPPPSPHDPKSPKAGEPAKRVLSEVLASPSLDSVAAYWTNSCAGGDSYENNCAHFLSDAFIRAGYADLQPPATCINARCTTTAKRPVRARDMWCWFQSKATKTSRQLTKNTGWWAIFQVDESVYWGGHVVLFDSNTWTHYGTGWYENWNQYLYQW